MIWPPGHVCPHNTYFWWLTAPGSPGTIPKQKLYWNASVIEITVHSMHLQISSDSLILHWKVHAISNKSIKGQHIMMIWMLPLLEPQQGQNTNKLLIQTFLHYVEWCWETLRIKQKTWFQDWKTRRYICIIYLRYFTSCKSTWDPVPYFGLNGLSMILCLWTPLHPLSNLQDHAQNLKEQLWIIERKR